MWLLWLVGARGCQPPPSPSPTPRCRPLGRPHHRLPWHPPPCRPRPILLLSSSSCPPVVVLVLSSFSSWAGHRHHKHLQSTPRAVACGSGSGCCDGAGAGHPPALVIPSSSSSSFASSSSSMSLWSSSSCRPLFTLSPPSCSLFPPCEQWLAGMVGALCWWWCPSCRRPIFLPSSWSPSQLLPISTL